ncbi:MAG: sulfotransferase [Pseudomonadota bacterium]
MSVDPVNLRQAVLHKVGGFGLEAAWLARDLVGGAGEARPFLIFGRGRSGSTLLVSLLDSHPAVVCHGETMRYRVLAPEVMIRRVLRVAGRAPGAAAVGFKLLSYQLRDIHRFPPQSDLLARLAGEGVRIFYLRRENLVRHALSNLVARQRWVFHSTDPGAEVKAERFDLAPETLLEWMRGSAALHDYERAVLDGVPHRELIYERDLAEADRQAATYRLVLEDLGLAWQRPHADLRPVTPQDPGEIIGNWDAVRGAIARSEFAKYLP